jgi:hypothetical protein
MKILRERQDHDVVEYCKHYNRRDRSGGYVFPCDEHGVIDMSKANPESVEEAKDETKFFPGRVEEHTTRWRENAVGECEVCGTEVELGHFTCTCDRCGADYNWAGQRLASRCQWGEETGETAADILVSDAELRRSLDD